MKNTSQTATAVLTPAVLTMVADGRVEPAELAQLGSLCALHPLFSEITPEMLMRMIRDIVLETADHGGPAVGKAAAARLSPGLRETAMCFAMRVALADGSLSESEQATVAGMASLLDLPPESFAKIFEVTAMMQRSAA